MNSWHLRQAAFAVKNGGLIAYPTEGVYGLGCDPWRGQAVYKLLKLKQRDVSKGLIVVAAHIEQLYNLIDIDKIEQKQVVMETWPGPVTWILPAKADTPVWLRGQHESLAVRVSAHPVIQALCRQCGPLVSTSANRSNGREARSSQAVRNYFRSDLDFIVPGKIATNRGATEIRHAGSGKIVRAASVLAHSGGEEA